MSLSKRAPAPRAWSWIGAVGFAAAWAACVDHGVLAFDEGAGGARATRTVTTTAGARGSGGGSTTSSEAGAAGAGTSEACAPESDAAFCARLGKMCDTVTGTDLCGAPRSADCGTCPTSLVCVSNACQAPDCASLQFGATGAVIATVNTSGEQNIPAAVTPSGSTILLQRTGSACGSAMMLFIADETAPSSGVYSTQAVSPPSDLLVNFEENVTLTADGLTLISASADRSGFRASTRSGPGMVDFGPPSSAEFDALTVVLPVNVWAPAISADGLAFYYVIHGTQGAAMDGIYESVRASTSVPFPPGQRMPALVQFWGQYVTALSLDRMAMFVESQPGNYNTFVLTRSSLAEPFANVNVLSAPPVTPGFRARPFANCMRLLGTCTPGGCTNEKICGY
jgi:hypothetical protein